MTKANILYKYSFHFAPEGRKVDTIEAASLDSAKTQFYSRNPQYKAAKGEIYINKLGAHGWPLVPSKTFPGEDTLSCPDCGRTDIKLSVIYGPGGRLGDPGAVNTITCGVCGKREYESRKTGEKV